jgi:hypothetical protein
MSLKERTEQFCKDVHQLFESTCIADMDYDELKVLIENHKRVVCIGTFESCFERDKEDKIKFDPEKRAMHTTTGLVAILQEVYNEKMKTVLNAPKDCIEIDATGQTDEPLLEAKSEEIENEESENEESENATFLNCEDCGKRLIESTSTFLDGTTGTYHDHHCEKKSKKEESITSSSRFVRCKNCKKPVLEETSKEGVVSLKYHACKKSTGKDIDLSQLMKKPKKN